MTFSDLLQLASERLGVEIEDAGGAAGVEIDGAPVVLQDAGDLLRWMRLNTVILPVMGLMVPVMIFISGKALSFFGIAMFIFFHGPSTPNIAASIPPFAAAASS